MRTTTSVMNCSCSGVNSFMGAGWAMCVSCAKAMPPSSAVRPSRSRYPERAMALLFPELADLPEGFVYRSDVISKAEEDTLLQDLKELAFGEVRMRGQVARRRTVHFGWTYGYETWRVEPGPPIPAFLLGLRARAAALVGVAPDAMAEVLVTHYPPDAGIGWHRDAPAFGVAAGVSLPGAGRFRFQQGPAAARRTPALTPAPAPASRPKGA